MKSLDEVLAELSPEERARVELRYQELRKEIMDWADENYEKMRGWFDKENGN